MMRHYSEDGPCLFELHELSVLGDIDLQMAAVLSGLGAMLAVDPQLRNFSLGSPQDLLRMLVQ
jgi:hypothetical protein